jgi:hypothetical protein
MQKQILLLAILLFFTVNAFAQTDEAKDSQVTASGRNFSISTPYLVFANFGEEMTNTHHYEFHLKYDLTLKDKIGVKLATWKLFRPMGILWWEGALEMDKTEFYPGELWENGIGVTYQRIIWKGLFAAVEFLPQIKTYFDEDNNKIGNGFKLYTSLHLGYHIPLFKNRVFVEPQIHCQWWPIDTNTPQSFKEKDSRWHRVFLFEPNLYIGIKF